MRKAEPLRFSPARAARAALENLSRASIPVSVNTQLNRWTWQHLPELLDLLIEHRAHAWQLALTVPMGRAADRPDMLLQPYELLDVFPALASLYPRAEAAGVRIFAGNNVGYFGPHEEQLRRHLPEGHTKSCGAGRSVLGIDCHHRALELARAGLRERLERVAPPPGAPFEHALFELVCEPLPAGTARA